MELLAPLLVILALGLVVLVVGQPLRRRGRAAGDPEGDLRRDLETARDAKYREIRDAELDFRTGKLSEADYRAVDRQLRAEAIEILRRLDELQ